MAEAIAKRPTNARKKNMDSQQEDDDSCPSNI